MIMRNTWLNTVRSRRAQAAAIAALPDDEVDQRLVRLRATRAQVLRVWARLPVAAQAIVVQCLVRRDTPAAMGGRRQLTKAAVDASIYRTRKAFREAGLGP